MPLSDYEYFFEVCICCLDESIMNAKVEEYNEWLEVEEEKRIERLEYTRSGLSYPEELEPFDLLDDYN